VLTLEIAALAAGVARFDSLGLGNPPANIAIADGAAPLDETLGTVALWVLVGIVGWSLITGLAYAGATLFGRTDAAHRIGRVTPRAIRLCADRLAAVSLAVAILSASGPAMAAGSIRIGGGPTTPDPPRSAEIPHPGIQRLARDEKPAAAPALPTSPSRADGEYLVAPGDNLWRIAADHLTATPDTSISLRAYWLMVIEVNRNRLRSGDPNLIFPGETIILPPLSEAS
jgi:hypothetical protein